MIKWYHRIGNPIKLWTDGDWITGKIVMGYRTYDGFINVSGEDGKQYSCREDMENICFKKTDDSLGDMQTNAEKIRGMNDNELAAFLRDVVATDGRNMFLCEDYRSHPACKGSTCEECEMYLYWLKTNVDINEVKEWWKENIYLDENIIDICYEEKKGKYLYGCRSL